MSLNIEAVICEPVRTPIGRIEVVKVENKGKGFRRLRIAIAD